jgi:predicted PurR-regulated permease PerM
MRANVDGPLSSPPEPPGRHLIDHAITYGLLGLLILLVYRIFAPLFPSLLWGALLAVVCAHPYERLAGRLRGRRHLADAVFGLMLIMVLLLPALFFAWELIVNFPALNGQIEKLSSTTLPPLPAWVADVPIVGPEAQKLWRNAELDLSANLPALMSMLGGAATWGLGQIGSFGKFLFDFGLGALISLFMLHHRFRVRAVIHRMLMRAGGRDISELAERGFDTTRAAFAGVVAAAIAQTLLGSVAIFAVGLPVVLFAGFIFLLAMVQIGPLVVLLVAVTILVLQQSYLSAVFLALWFLVVVMSVDNLVRPYFASKGSDVPGIVTFLGAIGGFLAWGLIGVFVGPVLISVLYELFMAWNDREGPLAPEQ